ncbi:MAG: hypothetical protein ACOYLB_16775, partial [Phototrophicaceae bacterium]
MALRPALVIGLGAFGSQALSSLITQLRHGYSEMDIRRMSFLALGLTPQLYDPLIQSYTVQEDTSDWFGVKPQYSFLDRNTTPVALRDWFNPQNRVQARAGLPTEYNRQLARALFLHHLVSGSCELPQVLHDLLEKFKKDQQAQTLLPVFVLARLDEAFFSATLIDVLSLLGKEVDKIALGNLRTMVCATLPSAHGKSNEDANIYATLQEMQRFILNGDASQTSPLIHALCLNDEAPQSNFAEDSLCHSWSYSLISLLDDGLGEYINQHWLVNRPQSLSSDRQPSHSIRALSMRSSAVVVPRHQLIEQWINRLTNETLITRFQVKSSITPAQILNDWMGISERSFPLRSPYLLRWLVETILQGVPPNVTQQWWSPLVGEVHTPPVYQHVTQQHKDIQHWLPTLTEAHPFRTHVQPAADFHALLYRKIVVLFGTVEGDGLGGYYGGDVAKVAEHHLEFCKGQTLIFLDWLLNNHPQLTVPTLTALRKIFQDVEKKLAQELRQYDSVQRLYDDLESFKENLKGFYEPQFMGLGSAPSAYLQAYVQAMRRWIDEMKQRVIVWNLRRMCQLLDQFVEECITSVKKVAPYVWEGKQSLVGYAQHTPSAQAISQVGYSLSNPNWNEAQYRGYKDAFHDLPTLLKWEVMSSTAINLSINGRALINEADFKEKNYRAWRAIIAERFIPVWQELTIWNYLNDAHNSADRQRVESAEHIQLSPLLKVQTQTNQLRLGNYVGIPKDDPNYDHISHSLSTNLANRLELNPTYRGISANHAYVYFSTLDLAPLHQITAYQEAQRAYRKLTTAQRLNTHTRVEDVTAVRLLDKSPKWFSLSENLLISMRMYDALQSPQNAKLFILLSATVGSIVVYRDSNRPDHFYWGVKHETLKIPLTHPTPNLDMGEGFIAFCTNPQVEQHYHALMGGYVEWISLGLRTFTQMDQSLT